MTPQELKNSILQLAIQGKLVEQRPEEGTAAELLRDILTQRRRDAECAKVGRDYRARRNASATAPRPLIPDDEKPFDIPEIWEWVRIGEVFNLQAGKNIKSEEIHQEYSSEHKYKCYGGNGCRGYVADYNRTGHHVLIGRQGALCGNINYAEGDFYATEHAVVVEQFAGTDVYWCGYFLDALNLNRYATATAQPGLAVAKINQVLIPLPPLAEQKRIVAKIEELLPLIDRYEKAWSRLEDFNKRFPVDMQKSLLQLAIQGKLVEQRPEEGTAAELLEKIFAAKNAKDAKKNLTRSRRARGEKATSAPSVSPRDKIPDDEKPFDIPESWEWVRLGEVASVERGSGIKRSETSSDGFPCVRYGEIYTSYGYSFTNTKSFVPEQVADSCHLAKHGDVLCTLTGEWKEEIAKATAYLGNAPIAIGGDLAKISSVAFSPVLLVYFFFAPFMIQQKASKANGTMIVHIGKDAICNLLIPLPPLAEQKRIVAKLEELLPLCERLK